MLGKRLYILAIIYIALLAIIIRYVYPELNLSSLLIVIGSLGFVLAFVTDKIINQIKRENGDEKDDQ